MECEICLKSNKTNFFFLFFSVWQQNKNSLQILSMYGGKNDYDEFKFGFISIGFLRHINSLRAIQIQKGIHVYIFNVPLHLILIAPLLFFNNHFHLFVCILLNVIIQYK